MGKWHYLQIYNIWWRDDTRGQILMLEGWKYLYQEKVQNLVIIFCQVYCYVHQFLQMKNIWVSWCVGPTILLQICCLCNPWMIQYILCYVIYIFRRWCDGLYITYKGSKFMDDRLFTISFKVRWGIVVSGLRTRIECQNYEAVRVFQLGFQPQTVANPALDSGYPHSLFNPNYEVCMPGTRDDINIS